MFWNTNHPGGEYDAAARRGSRGSLGGTALPAGKPPAEPPKPSPTSRRSADKDPLLSVENLNKSLAEMRITVEEMEKERDFYFGKLRDIEIATQKITDPQILRLDLFKQITEILYKTEDGFEIPVEGTLHS